MKRKTILGGLLIVVAATLAWQWETTVPGEAATTSANEALRSERIPGVDSQAGRPAPVATPAIGRVAPRPADTPRSPRLRDILATDRKAAFERLAAMQDPSSAKLAAEVAMSCSLYSDSAFPRTLAGIEAGMQPPHVKALQRETAQRERAKCIGFEERDIERRIELERFAHENGEPRTFAYGIASRWSMPERIAAAQQAALLDDSVALREIGIFFIRRPDVPEGFRYDLGDGAGVSNRIIRDAFFLAACHYGDDCGPSNGQLAARCVNAGWCDASSLEDSFIRYTYSPAATERLLYARQVVLSGIHTGRWPPGLWNPAWQ